MLHVNITIFNKLLAQTLQVCFAGRSNVGKSSLIGSLLNNNQIVAKKFKVSSTPVSFLSNSKLRLTLTFHFNPVMLLLLPPAYKVCPRRGPGGGGRYPARSQFQIGGEGYPILPGRGTILPDTGVSHPRLDVGT